MLLLLGFLTGPLLAGIRHWHRLSTARLAFGALESEADHGCADMMRSSRKVYGNRLSKPAGLYLLRMAAEPLLPWYRLVRNKSLYAAARWRARRPGPEGSSDRPPLFVIGCGRSGTSLLGALLGAHEEVRYLWEPWHLWAAVNPLTDFASLYFDRPGRCIMGARDCDAAQRRRFERLFLPAGSAGPIIVEKTPINAMRIDYLEALAPGARYLHIMRDGGDVGRSIEKLALRPPYRIGARRINYWWGSNNAKWEVLLQDGAGIGLPGAEEIATHAARGAYEWMVSLREVERHRSSLGDRLHELTYNQLTRQPRVALVDIAGAVGLSATEKWLDEVERFVSPRPGPTGEVVELPAKLARVFNDYQERFGFSSRAGAVG